ncbi:uncharacterized protein [Macrobrachium rosenbergii]|uniref:uncharacterized protein n=1 Tax=Macrobrachium rosenbergii TaxID=79674 RepID=UPI0034D785C2
MKSTAAREMRQVLDGLTDFARQMRELGQERELDSFMTIEIASRKIESGIYYEYMRQSKCHNQTLAELITYLRRETEARERREHPHSLSDNTNKSAVNYFRDKSSECDKSLATLVDDGRACPFCIDKTHLIIKCPIFISKTKEERRRMIVSSADTTLLKLSTAKHFGLQGEPFKFQYGVAGGGIAEESSAKFSIQIRPVNGIKSYNVIAIGIEKPAHNSPAVGGDIFDEYPHLNAAKGSLPTDEAEIDIIIGYDYYFLTMPVESVKDSVSPESSPIAVRSILGWTIFGGNIPKPKPHAASRVQFLSHLEDLQKLYTSDVVGVKPTTLCVCSDKEIAESQFIKHCRNKLCINADGRMTVEMPWKPGFPEALECNKPQAEIRLMSQEKRLIKNGTFDEYSEEIQKLIDSCFVRELYPEESRDEGWYLQHHAVYQLHKSTKVRIVWNSAAKFNGLCLNDGFYKGPGFLNSLLYCLLHWRMKSIGIAGDVQKMFNQILMAEKDQRYHRFVWRFDLSSPIRHWQWLRLPFGDKPAPDIAMMVVRTLADTFKEEEPIGAQLINCCMYMDDVIESFDKSELAIAAMDQVDRILRKGSFRIKEWHSNDPSVDRCPEDKQTRVLGHVWDKATDSVPIQLDKFSSVIWLKWNISHGVELKFVIAKSLVAPLKQRSIPRLELTAAVVMARLALLVLQVVGRVSTMKFWTDSEVVLAWVRSPARTFKPFVSARVQEIQDAFSGFSKEFCYVPSQLNPADALTKPIKPSELQGWINGPDFLLNSSQDCDFGEPTYDFEKLKKLKYTPESLKRIQFVEILADESFEERFTELSSDWNRLVRITAYWRRLLLQQNPENYQSHLEPKEIQEAELALFYASQKSLNNQDEVNHKQIKKLDPKLDEKGILRIGGRLHKLHLPYEQRHPVLLVRNSSLAEAFGQMIHRCTGHQGYRVSIALAFKRGVYIIGGARLFKDIAFKCCFCRTRRRLLLGQQMGELPSFRGEPNTPLLAELH